eukprot:2181116-Pleurochrysis_carterae.AAC.1
MHVEEVKKTYVVDVEATPSRSEAGKGPAGPPFPELRRQMPFPARRDLSTAIRDASCCVCVSVETRSSRVTCQRQPSLRISPAAIA